MTVREDPKLGKILTDARGMTLYRYTKDPPDQSVCTGGCARAWPPLTISGSPDLAEGIPGQLGVITRADGTRQVTYNHMPLYYYAADRQPGETTGQGVGNVWYVVTPAAGTAAANGSTGSARGGY